MARPTGPGKTEVRSLAPPAFMIYNFDIDGDELKVEHHPFLRAKVIPTLRSGGSVSVIGLASRSGSESHNQSLSERRVAKTIAFLRGAVPSGFNVRQATGFGERAAAREGYRDGTEDERFRTVLLFLSSTPRPPDVPPVIDPTLPGVLPDTPVPGDTVLDTIGKILDVVGGVASLLTLITAGALAAALEVFGTIAGIISAILSLPLTWASTDRLARFNGKCQGFWNAMEDMARAFADPGLDGRPESEWPSVPRPVPHLSSTPDSDQLEADRQWRAGEREGCRAAFHMIQTMERQPLERSLVVAGSEQRVRMTGRVLLRLMWIASRGHVAEFVRDEINRRLRAQGHTEWPVTR